jgi:hypothetical protein
MGMVLKLLFNLQDAVRVEGESADSTVSMRQQSSTPAVHSATCCNSENSTFQVMKFMIATEKRE